MKSVIRNQEELVESEESSDEMVFEKVLSKTVIKRKKLTNTLSNEILSSQVLKSKVEKIQKSRVNSQQTYQQYRDLKQDLIKFNSREDLASSKSDLTSPSFSKDHTIESIKELKPMAKIKVCKLKPEAISFNYCSPVLTS